MLSDAEQKSRAEGKAEGKLEVAKAMKAKGLDDATIIELRLWN
jgi:hypothetical protein